MKLYGYWRSSASWRVRIGLHLKGLPFENTPVNLLEGAHRGPEHTGRNPMRQVPVLELDDGTALTQSLAILDYLDRVHPEPPIFPTDPVGRAKSVALAEVVNAGIQPLQNMAVLQRVVALGGDRALWGREAIQSGLEAMQAAAEPTAGDFLVGDFPTVADICLVPQLYNARRFDCDLTSLTLLTRVEERCAALPAFQAAHPERQPDARSPQ